MFLAGGTRDGVEERLLVLGVNACSGFTVSLVHHQVDLQICGHLLLAFVSVIDSPALNWAYPQAVVESKLPEGRLQEYCYNSSL